jgi:hypothetical protein
VRLSISGQVKREEYFPKADSLSAIPDTVTGSVGFFADLNRARYKVTTHYIGFDRDVDIDLSTRLLVGMWLAPTALGYDRGGIGPRGFFQTGARVSPSCPRRFARAPRCSTWRPCPARVHRRARRSTWDMASGRGRSMFMRSPESARCGDPSSTGRS